MGGSGNLLITQCIVAGAGAKIEYSYFAVPEPASAILHSLAGRLLHLTRRRSRSREIERGDTDNTTSRLVS